VKQWRWLAVSAVIFGTGALLLLVNSCSTNRTVVAPPEIEGATYVGDKVCLDCHANISRAFPASPHARLHTDQVRMPGLQGCESCHGPASKHVAVGGGRGKFIVNPGKEPEACFKCHLETHAEFHLPQHHPVIEGKMNCVQCHDPHGMDIMKPAGGLAMSRLNQTCAQCHREQTRPFVFEHQALREGCTICHNPHGSINSKLLVQRDSNLCLKCHAQTAGPGTGGPGHIFIGQIDHTSFLPYGTCWSAGCHTGVHGSNVSPHLTY
jgi:predicted CXXCH cytochrome family protein